MSKRAFIVHGIHGNPGKHWFPWLKEELEKNGFIAYVPAMPHKDTDYPKMKEWVNYLTKIAVRPDKNCYFVGHSLGCAAIMRFLENLKPNVKVGGALFVGGFSNDLGREDLHDFFTKPIDWATIRSHCKKFVVINSDTDKTVPLKHAGILQEKLGADVIIKPGMGHFSNDLKMLPEALEFLLKMSE